MKVILLLIIFIFDNWKNNKHTPNGISVYNR